MFSADIVLYFCPITYGLIQDMVPLKQASEGLCLASHVRLLLLLLVA